MGLTWADGPPGEFGRVRLPSASMASPVSASPADERLRRIEAVTDVVLAHLDIEELLAELLGRVQELLSVDTAAVLLLDPSGRFLVATAARGLEEEVRQGVRLPLGTGFAGRIAAGKQPVIVDDLDDADVYNPILRAKGVRSLLGVPLLSGGAVTGVLHVGSLTPRRFTEDDIGLLQLVADRIALVAQVRHNQAEREAATVLQRSLLPVRLPEVPGMELAARYVPGGMGAVGGDWYDLFTLPSGRVGVVIGDVVGHGLRAAVVMGRLRSALRAYALDSSDPAEVLTRLDRKVQHFEQEAMATVLFGQFDPSFDLLHVSLAGHLPPMLARPGEPGVVLDLPADPPLGARSRTPRRTTSVPVPPGALVCLYTDGLVERRGRSLDLGIEQLRRTVSAGPADLVCATVMAELVGADPSVDDIAVLVLRRAGRGDALDLEFPATPDSLKKIRIAVARWLSAVGGTPEETGDVLLAINEACSNVVEHAYGPSGGTIALGLRADPPDVVLTVRDTGTWRPPRGVHRGRGKLLMHGCSDEVTIDHGPDGTVVTLRRRLTGGAGQPAGPGAVEATGATQYPGPGAGPGTWPGEPS